MNLFAWIKSLFKPTVLEVSKDVSKGDIDIVNQPEAPTVVYSQKDQIIKKNLMARLDCKNISGFLETLKSYPVSEEMLADRELIDMMWKIFDGLDDNSLYKGRDTQMINFVKTFKVSQEEINQHVRDLVTNRIKDHSYFITAQSIDFMDRLSTDKSLIKSPEVMSLIKKCYNPRFEKYAPCVVILKVFKFTPTERAKILTGLLEEYAYDDRDEFSDFEKIFAAFGGVGAESIETVLKYYLVLISRGYDAGAKRLEERLPVIQAYGDDETFIKRQKEAALRLSLIHI
jgi:hypothetical protein